MLPPPRPKMVYEKVVEDAWINGVIEEIEYEMERKSTYKGVEKVGPAIRIRLVLEGYKFPKTSGWLSFIYSDKSNLYKTYICGLVANPKPYMEFDPDLLKGMKIKCMWETNPKNPEYQNLVRIRPIGEKIVATEVPEDSAPEETEIPF